ncbi:phosphoribosylformylglycinamidine cyclo-ligase [Tumebacillus sp. ITR2]|uniref:Phosphoribosylformylglycinamidine cyclo-ligase n=1 Tax=Tumebacillus amylolyticus TaxID=2801339 RepID=A0ABS1JG54_9BACL|nr:phosphoribosylformylglycinamidine cyclo-ligase [Tumebacillus amylolyticus]MBL0389238.1 phosphoribosylformylglycinamidine cyclo-ligase [Tumebacillus amylolyticus]
MSELYKAAGVDIDAGNEAVRRMKSHVARTMRPEVATMLGGFGGGFQLDVSKYKNPMLVSGTDGVGTKLKVAFAMNRHDTIGIDAVAMCVNDIIVMGAEPLFFLDYFATGKVEPGVIEDVVKGIADGCELSGCALIGGETAEMPGMYQAGEYDIAGFTVGVVDKDKMIDPSNVKVGDSLIGLASSGIHSNGYSLVRKLFFEDGGYGLDHVFPEIGRPLGEELLTPTRIYVKTVLNLLSRFDIRAMAHITGGGFLENIPRVLPEGVAAEIEVGSWPVLPVFNTMQRLGNIGETDLYRTFNMGIGMVLVVPAEQANEVLAAAVELGESAYLIGSIVEGAQDVRLKGTLA